MISDMRLVFHEIKSCLFTVACLFLYSCSPSINHFDVSERTVTSEDSVLVTWEVRGKASLIFHERPILDSAGIQPVSESSKFLEYTLVASKSGKEKRQTIQVVLLPSEASDSIIFKNVLSENGDTLIAIGEKNLRRWGNHFRIVNVGSTSSRTLFISHEGKETKLSANGTSSAFFAGTSIGGSWRICSLVTSQERANPSLLPEFLRLNVTIQYQKNN